MTLSSRCRCPGCLASLPPDPATATPAQVSAYAEHLRRLSAVGALPDPTFQPYPNLMSATPNLDTHCPNCHEPLSEFSHCALCPRP